MFVDKSCLGAWVCYLQTWAPTENCVEGENTTVYVRASVSTGLRTHMCMHTLTHIYGEVDRTGQDKIRHDMERPSRRKKQARAREREAQVLHLCLGACAAPLHGGAAGGLTWTVPPGEPSQLPQRCLRPHVRCHIA